MGFDLAPRFGGGERRVAVGKGLGMEGNRACERGGQERVWDAG